jgi:hypothetical protein
MIAKNHKLTGVFMLCCCSLLVPTVGASDGKPTADAKQLEAWWDDLEKGTIESSRALLGFSDHPQQALEFLKAKLKPLKLDAVRLKAYLLRLGSDNETLWKQAFEDLEYFDPRLAMDLEPLLEKVKESPTRQRLVEVLSERPAGSIKGEVTLDKLDQFDGYNFRSGNGSWWAEHKLTRINTQPYGVHKKKWARAMRGIVLLEHIGTPEARAVLEEMGTGHPDAQPTKEARLALERLNARPK